MPNGADCVNGWEVRARPDGSYAVCDDHGILAGPFGTRQQAIAAALDLPRAQPRPRVVGRTAAAFAPTVLSPKAS